MSQKVAVQNGPISRSTRDVGGRVELPIQLDRSRAIAKDEERAKSERVRLLLSVALMIWPVLVGTDLAVASRIAPGSFGKLLIFRIVMLVSIAAPWAYIMKRPGLPLRHVMLIDFFCSGSISLLIAVTCLFAGGVDSPYVIWLVLWLVGRSASRAVPWHRALMEDAITVLALPLTALGAVLFDEATFDHLRHPDSIAILIFSTLCLMTLGTILAWSSHMHWRVCRELYEKRHLGMYKLEYRLGRGGMSEVWVAHHLGLKRNVALKLLRTDDSPSPKAIARFELEVQATLELTHPNTIRLLDFGVTPDGIWYYAMELLEGTDLGTLIEKAGRLPPPRAIYLLRQVCASLSEAHKKGIIHRDIKPENIYVCAMGGHPDFVKVLDFGIAKMAERGRLHNTTKDDVIAGTPRYMAPEVLSGQMADARSDVYALGAVLYFMLCGRPLFPHAVDAQLILCQIKEEPALPSVLLEQPLPSDLEGIVMACLRKDPADRFLNAQELDEALATCIDAGEWEQRRLAQQRAGVFLS